MTSVPRRQRPGLSTAAAALLVASAFGLTGLVFGLQKIATVTLKHILAADISLSFQEVSDNLPVPRDLNWNLTLIQLLATLHDLRGPVPVVFALLLLAALGALFLWTVGQDRSGSAPQSDTARTSSDEPRADAITSKTAEELSSSVPTTARRRSALILAGLLYAACIFVLLAYGVPPVSETLLRYYHTMGTFHQGYWLDIAGPSAVSSVAYWSAGGLVLYAISGPGCRPMQRLAIVLCAGAAIGVALWLQRGLRIQVLAGRHDWQSILTVAPPYRPDRMWYGVPDGVEATQLLAGRLKLKMGEQKEQPSRNVLLFVPPDDTSHPAAPARAWQRGQVVILTQLGMTEDGLASTLDAVAPLRGFLASRHYESALSWVATKQLFNIATVHFDTTSALDACMTDLEKCPHLTSTGGTTRGILFTCAASPANLEILNRWADERNFAYPTRDSRRLMGQLYERFGEKERALAWYRKADMPKSFLARVEGERPLFHFGRVTGRLVLNGRPVAGAQVGAIPHRLNGLPPDMERTVLLARGEILAVRRFGLFPRYCPRPYAFRWISASAVTDSDGRFELNNLTEGEYMLTTTLPPPVRLESPIDPYLTQSRTLPAIVVNYRAPALELGEIGLKTGR